MRARAGVLIPAVLLLTATVTVAGGAGPELRARLLRDFVLDAELSEWPADGPHRFVLDEASLVRKEGSPLSTSWTGPADLWGEIHVGYNSTALLLAGRIRDDTATPNPRIW